MRKTYLIRWMSFRPANGFGEAQDADIRSGLAAPYGSVAEWLHLHDVEAVVEREYDANHNGDQWNVTDYYSILTKDQAFAFKMRFNVLPWRERPEDDGGDE